MPRATLIALSLAANAAFGAVLWLRHSEKPPAPTAASAPTSPPSAASSLTAAVTPLDAHTWSRLTTTSPTDDAAFVARLRSEGFPPRVVRSLVRSVLQQRFVAEHRDLVRQDNETPYWRNRGNPTRVDRETRQKLRALGKQISDQTRALLGPDADPLHGDVDYSTDARKYGPLPREKIAALKTIQRDYAELSSEVQTSSRGLLLREDREKLAFLETQQRADLVALLTPEELDHHDRRDSRAAHDTRGRLEHFDATEAEFLAVYRLQCEFDQQHGIAVYRLDHQYGDPTDKDRAAQREAATPQLEARIEAALGPARVDDYRIVTHDDFSNTRSFVTDLGLPAAAAKPLVRTQRDSDQRLRTILGNSHSLTPAQKTAAIHQLETEASSALTASLGPERFALYKKSSAGSWLAELKTLTAGPSD